MKTLIVGMAVAGLMACAGAPDTQRERAQLQRQASTTLSTMTSKDPSLAPLLDMAAGYVVFPDVGKGGFVVGGAHGQGVLYRRGTPIGYVELQQASIGAQVGAQSFAELIVLQKADDVSRIKNGTFSLSGNASAVALSAGVAGSTDFRDGTAVFVMPRGGAMAEVAIGGQRLRYSGGGG